MQGNQPQPQPEQDQGADDAFAEWWAREDERKFHHADNVTPLVSSSGVQLPEFNPDGSIRDETVPEAPNP